MEVDEIFIVEIIKLHEANPNLESWQERVKSKTKEHIASGIGGGYQKSETQFERISQDRVKWKTLVGSLHSSMRGYMHKEVSSNIITVQPYLDFFALLTNLQVIKNITPGLQIFEVEVSIYLFWYKSHLAKISYFLL